MDTDTLLRESQAEKLLETLQFQTQVGKQRFQAQIRLFSNQKANLEKRKQTILSVRQICQDPSVTQELDECFAQIAKIESELSIFFTQSDVEKNSYEQLTFSGWKWAQILNTIPFALLLVSYFKLYAVPALALMTPFFLLILPYLTLRYWYNMPITTEKYIQIVLPMFGLSLGENNWSPKNIAQGAITLFSIVQSIVQPIQNAIHLQTIHENLVKKGNAVTELSTLYSQILAKLPFSPDIKARHNLLDEFISSGSDTHRTFAEMWDAPFRLRMALDTLGDCEVFFRLATCSFLQPVQILQREGPYLLIQDGIDPFLQTKQCVPFSIRFLSGNHHHAILTGPNRGGKSSVLRATLLSVLMAQTFGMGFHTGRMLLKPFDWIATGLKLEDRPGKASMFEREVEFSTDILCRAILNPRQTGLVLFDELFHSTNPPDGAKTADIFLRKLWKQSNVISFISTHVFELARSAPDMIQKLCVPALQREDGSLHFTYTLKPGICEVSSVLDILKEKGLLESREILLPKTASPKRNERP